MAATAEKEKVGEKTEAKTDGKVLCFSTFPYLAVGLREEIVEHRESEKGKGMVRHVVQRGSVIQFNEHRYMATQEEYEILKTKPWYSVDMISAPDLKKMLKSEDTKTTAQGFIKQMARRSAIATQVNTRATYENVIEELAEIKV